MKKKTKILVVDDERGFTRLLKLIFQQYEIMEENDSRNAVETARAFQPDLILLDVIMPNIDGGNLAAKIKEDETLRNVPIVFLTAIVPAKEAGEAPRKIGGFSFLAKPVSPEALERCIEQHVPSTAA